MRGMPGVDIDRVYRRLLPFHLPAVLRPAGAERTPEQGAGQCDACRHSALPRQSWPGSDLGVRAPYPGETPLSWSEVLHAQVNGVLSLTTDPPGRCPTPP